MSIFREILEYLGLAERKPQRRRTGQVKDIRYAHPSHDPKWKSSKPASSAKQTSQLPQPNSFSFKPRSSQPQDVNAPSFDEVFKDIDWIKSIMIAYIDSCGDLGVDFFAINKYVLSKFYFSDEIVEKRSYDKKYKERLAAIRNDLKKAGKLYYDESRHVWKMKRTFPLTNAVKNTTIGRALTDKEKAYFAALGFQDGDGWRKIDDAHQAIEWIVANYDPYQFENFCIAVLKAHNVSLCVTKKNPVTGADGGFDGEGEYRLDDGAVVPVGLQAKRYAPHRQVDYTHCKEFVGSLFGRDWRHGFIMTTGTFTEGAWNYVKLCKERGMDIELIDQNILIEIMLKKTVNPHGFGLHKTDFGLVYFNEGILIAAGKSVH